MTFRRRKFPEVLDNLLTAIIGGVSAEAHPFPPPGASAAPYRHSLQQPPVKDIVSVYGSLTGEPHRFRKDADYRLLDDSRTLAWQEGADLPDPGTLIHVNYLPASAQPKLTDLYVGSVIRTLSEAVALEMTQLYAQLDLVYQSGFVDTATGSALENVVSLLGIQRISGGRAVGDIEFSRSPNSTGTITIPAGTRIITEDGSVEYETTATVTMPTGQNTIRVAARDLEPNDPLPADSLIVLPVPIAGVAGVSNPAPTALDAQEETDEMLRTRAKNFLHGSERATLGAIEHAVRRQGVTAEVVEDTTTPGIVSVNVHADALPPDLAQRIDQAILDSRPAGVTVSRAGATPPAKVDLAIRLITADGLLETDLRGAQRAVQEKIADYFNALPADKPASINKIVGLVLETAGVEDMQLLTAHVGGNSVLDSASGQLAVGNAPTTLGQLSITDPNLPTRLNVTITYPIDQDPPDKAQMTSALSAAVSSLNALNAGPGPVDPADQQVDYARLLHVTPLPGHAAATLDTFTGGAPPDVAPYTISFLLTNESGLSQTLASDATAAYTLTPYERLSLVGIEMQAEAPSA